MITVYVASFPNDSWGYFGTESEAWAWIEAFRQHKASLYDAPADKDGATVEPLQFASLSEFCVEVNGCNRAFWNP